MTSQDSNSQDVGSQQLAGVEEKIKSTHLPQDFAQALLTRVARLKRIAGSVEVFDEIDRLASHVDYVISLPWERRSEDVLLLDQAKQILDKHHYGLQDIKQRILEFISMLKLNSERGTTLPAPILCFVGLVGTGKTTVAYSIAEALGRKIERIAFGGMGTQLDLRGQSRTQPEAEPGLIVKAMIKAGVKNSVILLDEIDRVADEGRSSIMGVLIELLDPEQNHAFLDHYIDYPFDLSEALFVATANNTTNIATAVLDRLEIIQMPSYTDEEKIAIGKDYMFPKTVRESGLPEGVISIDDNLWPTIVRPLGYDSGMRSLERTIEGIIRRVAMEYVQGKVQKVVLNEVNFRQYLSSV